MAKSTPIDIRPINAQTDAEQLIAHWRSVWPITYLPGLGPAAVDEMLAELDQSGISSMLPDTGERGFCAIADGRIVGTIIIAERGPTAYVWGLYVHPSAQRAGVGTRLFKCAIRSVETAKRVELSVLTTSPWAYDFYRKQGLKKVSEGDSEVFGSIAVKRSVMKALVSDLRRALDVGDKRAI